MDSRLRGKDGRESKERTIVEGGREKKTLPPFPFDILRRLVL